MKLSGSEEDILREYKATRDHHDFYSNHTNGQILLESKYLPLAKHLLAESLSTLSQGNSPISQVSNILKPPSSERTQLRYGGCSQGDQTSSSQVNCVFELYHEDDYLNRNNNEVQPEEVLVPNSNEICFDQSMNYNQNTSMRIKDKNNNNTQKPSSNSSVIRVSPNNTFSSHRNNNNNLQLDIKQTIQDECPSKYLYNTILSGMSNGTGTIPQNAFQPITEQQQFIAIQKDEHTTQNMISNNQPPNYSDILNASVYSMYLQHNKKNISADQQSSYNFNRSSESSRIGHNSKNQVKHLPMNSRDSRHNTNTHYNSNNYSAAEALTQASFQSRNYPTNDFNSSQQDRVKMINEEALEGKSFIVKSDQQAQNDVSDCQFQTNHRGRNKTLDQLYNKKDQQQKDQVQQKVNCVVETSNQSADLSQLIDGFNLQSRLKINGIKSYERQHRHARFFQREIPLSLEDEQSFYLETSTKKHKVEFTKQVISPSTSTANNRQLFNKENTDRSNVQKQKQQLQLTSQQLKKEEITFESRQSSGAKEERLDSQKDKSTFSPCCKSSGRTRGRKEEENRKTSFNFQKNESTACKKQKIQSQMNENSKNSSRSNPTIKSTLHHNSSNCNNQDYCKDNQRKHKSQQHSESEQNQHQRIESSKLLKEKKSSRKDLRNTQDAATQVSIQHSRVLSSRNAQDHQSCQSRMQSPAMQVQGLVHDLSQPCVTSEQGNSQQNSTVLVDWSSSRNKRNSISNDRFGQVSQQSQKQQEILKQVASFRSYSSIRNRLLNKNDATEEIDNLGNDKDQKQQSKTQKQNEKENDLKATLKVRDNCQNIKESKIGEEDSFEQALFRNQVLQEQTGKLQLKKTKQQIAPPDAQKPYQQLRNNSCYSTGAGEYEGYLQPQNGDFRKNRRKMDNISASQQQSDVNKLVEKRKTKIKIISNNSRIESKNTAETSSKKSGNIKKNKHKIIQQDKDHTDYNHIPKESKQYVAYAVANPAVELIKNNEISSPSKSNVPRIRSKSLIDKIQDKVMSTNQITSLIEHHASCCRNFRKELQTSFYNN